MLNDLEVSAWQISLKLSDLEVHAGVERVEVILLAIIHINLYDTKDQRNNQRQILDC